MEINEKIKELRDIFERYENDELSLLDLDYLDEHFNELLEDLRQLKEDIVNERFIKSMEESF